MLTILQTYPEEYYSQISVNNYNDVFQAPNVFLSTLKNDVGLTRTRATLSLFVINDVVNMFNVGKNMNAIQVATLVDDILRIYPYFKVEDLKLCFQNARTRKKVFDRLDCNVVLEWLREYDIERAETSEQISINEFKKIENNSSTTYEDYLTQLKDRADHGDVEAIKSLNQAIRLKSALKKIEPDRFLYESIKKAKLNRK